MEPDAPVSNTRAVFTGLFFPGHVHGLGSWEEARVEADWIFAEGASQMMGGLQSSGPLRGLGQDRFAECESAGEKWFKSLKNLVFSYRVD